MLGRQMLLVLASELEALGKRVEKIQLAILAWHRDNESNRRLAEVLEVAGSGLLQPQPSLATVGNAASHEAPVAIAASFDWIKHSIQ